MTATAMAGERRAAVRGDGATAIIDLAFLRRFTLDNRELEREVLQLFAGQAPSYVAGLRTAATDKDWREAAHSLKGSARAVGAWHVARAAEALEAQGRATDLAERQRSLAPVEAALAQATGHIRELARAS